MTDQSTIIKADYERAMQLLNSGNAYEAIQVFEKIRGSWRDDPNIRYLEGLAYGRLSDIGGVIRSSEQALKLQADHFGALCNLANAQMLVGDKEEALANYKKALAQKPDALDVIDNYGRALYMLGHSDEAIVYFKKAIDLNKNYAPAHASLGRAYSEGGDPDAGLKEFNIALSLAPGDYGANLGVAGLYSVMGAMTESEHYYRIAIDLEKRAPDAYVGMAGVMSFKGEYREALDLLRKAEELGTTDHATVAASRADCYERLNDLNKALEILEGLDDDDRVMPKAVVAYTKICRKFDRCDHALELVRQSIDTPSTDTVRKQAVMYAAGSLLDKLGRYDEAFDYYRMANESIEYREKADFRKYYDDLIACFDEQSMRQLPRARTGNNRPVFIVGMPRSGTTLTEQIISSHPDVFGAGELGDIQQLSVEFSEFNGVNEAKLTGLARKYLSSLERRDSKSRFVTDKMPGNFQNVGLISLLFPEARIIHCRRNPLDNCLSVYFQNFIWTHDYATDLAAIGAFYNQYDRLMAHWASLVDIPILTVHYEDLVADQENMTRALLEFCDLEWNESVMKFYESGRAVATASYDEVRRPIYDTSRYRWRKYAKYLGPLRDNLSDHLLSGIEDLDLIP